MSCGSSVGGLWWLVSRACRGGARAGGGVAIFNKRPSPRGGYVSALVFLIPTLVHIYAPPLHPRQGGGI